MNDDFTTWNDGDEVGKANAFSKFSDNVNSYTGLNKSQGNT